MSSNKIDTEAVRKMMDFIYIDQILQHNPYCAICNKPIDICEC